MIDINDEQLKAIARHIMIKISNDLHWTIIPPKYEEWVLNGLREVADYSRPHVSGMKCDACEYFNKSNYCTHCGVTGFYK